MSLPKLSQRLDWRTEWHGDVIQVDRGADGLVFSTVAQGEVVEGEVVA